MPKRKEKKISPTYTSWKNKIVTHLIIENTGMLPRNEVAMTIVCKAHIHVST